MPNAGRARSGFDDKRQATIYISRSAVGVPALPKAGGGSDAHITALTPLALVDGHALPACACSRSPRPVGPICAGSGLAVVAVHEAAKSRQSMLGSLLSVRCLVGVC